MATTDSVNFPLWTFSSINCNSLNVSNITSYHHKLKLYGITKLKSSIILLSDIRLGSSIPSINQIQKTFLVNPYCPYDFHYNSTKNSRGVGILINHNLSAQVEQIFADEAENILVLKVTTTGKTFLLCSIYGPNHNDPGFFALLWDALAKYSSLPVIMGGDWNCTFSSDPLSSNLDIMDMMALPNQKHSTLLSNLCDNFKLCDPFRSLYPKKREFSYTPRDKNKTNKSRLDFFIISKSLSDIVSECSIAETTQNNLFDHKACLLSLVKKKSPNSRPCISDFILNDNVTELLVGLTTCECYLHHAILLNNNARVVNKNRLGRIGEAKNNLRTAGIDDSLCEDGPRSNHDNLIRDNLIAGVRVTLADLMALSLELSEITVDADIFLEYLVNCIRNEVISYQTFVFKNMNAKSSKLSNELFDLKLNYEANKLSINEKERQLNSLLDKKMKADVSKYRLFENLNAEKITPYFVTLAKNKNCETSLAVICDENGSPFPNENDRASFITRFYANLYKKPDTEPDSHSGCIEEFLGGEILAHPIVQGSILSPAEKTKLDTPFSLTELDKAAKEANVKSAPGPDGLSTKFILKFWHYLRTPLFKYALCCFEKGHLFGSFKTACVRLIPKKGDLSKLKNWRPISLLSNLYKIISRALNNRLSTVMDKITSRAQKGFTSSRFLQEVLINVIECIANCKVNKTNAAIVAIDMAKAFDTLSHGFLSECYKFFGLGDYFINMIETVGRNRTASIILDSGELSPAFNLETGRPQGEILSPNTYNIPNQILLFRIELDKNVASVFQHMLGPSRAFALPKNDLPTNQFFINESNRETDKVEGFADDTTGITICEEKNLLGIKNILCEFAAISGLHANYDKTQIMPIGENPNILFLDSLGIPVVESCTILGMQIDKNLELLGLNFEKIINKMVKTVNFWRRFNLSLPGRIVICKTYLLSLVSHLGCFLSPEEDQVAVMQLIMNSFCKGNLKVSEDRIYLDPKLGGLGLINIRDFITAQHCQWFKRAEISTRDNWRVDLQDLSFGNVYTASHHSICEKTHPILNLLARSMVKFSLAFTSIGHNYKNAFLLNNPFFRRGKSDMGILDCHFFGVSQGANIFNIAKLKFSDCYVDNVLKSFVNLNNDTGININLATYFRLRQALALAENNSTIPEKPQSIGSFFVSYKKGSKSCRRILGKVDPAKALSKLQSLKTFFFLIDEQTPEYKTAFSFLPLWNSSGLPNRLREFLFKFFNNQLGLNTRISHFVGGSRGCTFCVILKKDNPPDESFSHLFYDCEVVKNLHNSLEETALKDSTGSQKMLKRDWFGVEIMEKENKFKRILILTIQFFVWEAKLQKKLPVANHVLGETISLLENAMRTDTDLRLGRVNFNCHLCRHWDTLRELRW